MDQNLARRYLYEASRHLEYDAMEEAKEAIQGLIDEGLSKGKSLERVLEELGDPYVLGQHFARRGNLLTSGRTYDEYVRVLLVTAIGTALGILLSRGGDALGLLFSGESFLLALWTILFALVERAKMSRLGKRLLEPWHIEALYGEGPGALSPLRLAPAGIWSLLFGHAWAKGAAAIEGLALLFTLSHTQRVLAISLRAKREGIFAALDGLGALLSLYGFFQKGPWSLGIMGLLFVGRVLWRLLREKFPMFS